MNKCVSQSSKFLAALGPRRTLTRGLPVLLPFPPLPLEQDTDEDELT